MTFQGTASPMAHLSDSGVRDTERPGGGPPIGLMPPASRLGEEAMSATRDPVHLVRGTLFGALVVGVLVALIATWVPRAEPNAGTVAQGDLPQSCLDPNPYLATACYARGETFDDEPAVVAFQNHPDNGNPLPTGHHRRSGGGMGDGL
jgi:hypothetical protein